MHARMSSFQPQQVTEKFFQERIHRTRVSTELQVGSNQQTEWGQQAPDSIGQQEPLTAPGGDQGPTQECEMAASRQGDRIFKPKRKEVTCQARGTGPAEPGMKGEPHTLVQGTK